MASLDAATGVLIATRDVKNTLNIIWCADPRDGLITEPPIEMGFVDGDECGGADVFWLDWNQPLIAQGSEIEGFAIAGMEIVNQGYLGYGILHSVVDQGRWSIDAYEYFAPSTGMMPYDLILTPDGPIVVGRAYNTAWVQASVLVGGASSPPVLAASPTTGAATLVTSDFAPSGRFLDDNTSVFEADIEWLAAEGVTRGCNPPDNTRFCPTGFVTRGQMAAFLVRALGLTDSLDGPFSDDDASIFEADIEKLAAAGITKGCNPPANDRYCPDSVVTRGQMAAFLVRAFKYTDDGGADLFSDDDASIFESDIDKLGTAGVTRGCNPPTNEHFCPDAKVTRGQMAAFIHRTNP